MTIVADNKTRNGRAIRCTAARRGGDNPIISPAHAALAELDCAFLHNKVCKPCHAKAHIAIRQHIVS
jgi:hypothetical protein